MENIPVTVQLSYPYGPSSPTTRVNLRVIDVQSRVLLIDLVLNAEEFTSLLGSSSIEVIGTIANAKNRAWIGKRKVIYSEPVPKQVMRYANRLEMTAMAQEWADKRMDELNYDLRETQTLGLWEAVTVSSHNYGWKATFARWEESES